MLAQLRSSLTYANVMATVAVFVALGGTSYAVATGSIDSREIKNNSVRGKDIRNRTIAVKDISREATASLEGQQGPAGPTGRIGPVGPTGADGTARAYAHVVDGPAQNVSVDAAQSKGMTAANLAHTETSAGYCFSGLGFTPGNAVATPDVALAGFSDSLFVGVGALAGCAPGTQVTVLTQNNGANADGSFYLLVN